MSNENEKWQPIDNVTSADRTIELHAIQFTIADETIMDESGVETLGTALILALRGHLHPEGLGCIPVTVPFVVRAELLDHMIEGLTDTRDEIAAEVAKRHG
jgi:hypothetical protein